LLDRTPSTARAARGGRVLDRLAAGRRERATNLGGARRALRNPDAPDDDG